MSLGEPTVPQWVCVHCYVHLVNGDCTEVDTCDPGTGTINDPLHLFGDMVITAGMLMEHHGHEEDYECDCERREYSTSQCDGCGSWYHGQREAVTGWIKEEVAS